MKREVSILVSELGRHLKRAGLSKRKIRRFKKSLKKELRIRYDKRWNYEKPHQFSDYRKLNISCRHTLDNSVRDCGNRAGLTDYQIRFVFIDISFITVDPESVVFYYKNGVSKDYYEDKVSCLAWPKTRTEGTVIQSFRPGADEPWTMSSSPSFLSAEPKLTAFKSITGHTPSEIESQMKVTSL